MGSIRYHIASVCIGLMLSDFAVAQHSESVSPPWPTEKENSGWAFYIDNDAMISGSPDRDYTGGFGITLSGRRATRFPVSIDTWRNSLDELISVNSLTDQQPNLKLHSFEFGVALFTPNDQTSSAPLFDDHPYANLVFIANTEQTVIPAADLAYQSTLTVGLLGTALGERLQTSVHHLINEEEPRGWNNQISDGGELTARYTLSVQKTQFQQRIDGRSMHELKTSAEVNLGFSTDINIGFNWRIGKIDTPWWSFNPHQAEYINLGSPISSSGQHDNYKELYFWVGGTLKYRFYNAILQGQFRDSKVTFNHDELEHTVGEIWGGITTELGAGFRVSLFYRARSAEIRSTTARNPRWGGLILSRTY